jgi:hypothetical protein
MSRSLTPALRRTTSNRNAITTRRERLSRNDAGGFFERDLIVEGTTARIAAANAGLY